MSGAFTAALRRRFIEIADVLIPEAQGMPSASQVGLEGAWLDRVLELRPELTDALLRGLRTLDPASDPKAAAEDLNARDPEALGTIGLVASAAYYMDAEVRRRLGYPGQASRPVQASEENDFLADGLLQPVIDRGPIYRPTPGAKQPNQ